MEGKCEESTRMTCGLSTLMGGMIGTPAAPRARLGMSAPHSSTHHFPRMPPPPAHLAPFGRQAADPDDRLDVVPVDVQDGRVEGLGDVGAVRAAAAVLGVGREGDLGERARGEG